MKNSYFFVAIIFIIGVTSVLLVARSAPEQITVGSDDGVVLVSGLTRAKNSFEIVVSNTESAEFFISSQYEISPSQIKLESLATVTFNLENFENRDSIVVYQFNDTIKMWEPMDEVSHDGKSIIINSDQLGRFVLGRPVTVEVPNFLTTIDELMSLAPSTTVSYDIHIGLMIDENSVVYLLPEETIFGGCNGDSTRGLTSQISNSKQGARVLVNDVQTDVEFIFFAQWYGNTDGCAEGKNLEPIK